ncbi:MAG: hypothetical protein F6J97_08225 [Leptolyngbya sp. SIO4C1]|nr:hypothetical protein [Leptolyngbya sp. SIO4C1]
MKPETTNFRNHRFAGGAFTALSLLLLLAETPILFVLALMGGMGGLGYLLATATLETPIRRAESRLDAAQRAIDERSASIKAERADLKEKLRLTNARLDTMHAEAEQMKAELRSEYDRDIRAARKALADEFRQQGLALEASYAEKIKDKDSYMLERIKHHKSKLIGDNQQLHERIEQLETLLQQRDTYLLEEFNKRLQGYDADFKNLKDAALSQAQNVGEARAAYEAEFQALRDERDRLVKEVRRLMQPKRFRRNTDRDVVGNKILDFFKSKGVLLEGEDWSERFNHVDYFLYPMPSTSVDQVKAQLEDLQIHLGVFSRPKAVIEDGFIKLTVQVGNQPKAVEIPSTPLTRVEKSIDLANHLRIVGPSGSGKSTWLDNVIWLGLSLWPTANHTILDPKYPFTQWSNIKPDFKNDECVTKIQEIGSEMAERFSEANQVADEHGADSEGFSRYLDGLSYELFVIDEAQDLYRRAKKCDRTLGNRKNELANGVRDSLLECLNVGRALKVKTYFITQSAKCSKINLNEDDFDNAVSIFLGASISYALSTELKDSYSSEKLSLVRAEYVKRKELGQQYLGLISDLERDDLYLFELPRPGFYYERVMHSRPPSAPVPVPPSERAETIDAPMAPSSTKIESEGASTESAPDGTESSTDLAQLLEQGTRCPHCGTKSNTYKRKTPTKKGEVTVRCKTPNCRSNGSFKWKVV